MTEKTNPVDGPSRRVETIRGLLQKYPQELSWLTGDVHSSPEIGGAIVGDKTAGEAIFPNLTKDQIKEFDRTAVGLLTFLWALGGDYDSFVECQPSTVRLTRESFDRLHEFTKRVVPDKEAKNAMSLYLVINDLTKVSSVVEEMKKRTGNIVVDHDVLLLDVLQNHQDLSPSFAKSPAKYQELITGGLKAKFNMAHLSQGEGPAAILSGLKGIDEDSLNFYLIHVLFDTAGVVGHLKQNGSLVMTEPTYRNMEMAIDAINYLRAGNSEARAYNYMLENRAKEWKLDIKSSMGRAAARVACMLRLHGKEDEPKVAQIVKVINSLEDSTRKNLIRELDTSGIEGETAIMLYYAPAILANTETALKKQNDPQSFEHAVVLGLETFTSLYQQARERIKDRKGKSGLYTVMCSDVAALAGKDPNSLLRTRMFLQDEGDDAKIVLS